MFSSPKAIDSLSDDVAKVIPCLIPRSRIRHRQSLRHRHLRPPPAALGGPPNSLLLPLPEEEGAELDSKLNCRVFCWTGVGCFAGGGLSLDATGCV